MASYTANAPTGAGFSGIPQSTILAGNLAAYAVAIALDSNGNVYAITTGSSMIAAGCKIITVSPSIFNNALVLDVNYECSGKYLVSP